MAAFVRQLILTERVPHSRQVNPWGAGHLLLRAAAVAGGAKSCSMQRPISAAAGKFGWLRIAASLILPGRTIAK